MEVEVLGLVSCIEAFGRLGFRCKADHSPGKVYTLGPGESFSNFEVHLKNRGHIEKRVATGRK